MAPENIFAAALLQLGHGDEAVETNACLKMFRSLTSLQLGHGDEAVETERGP